MRRSWHAWMVGLALVLLFALAGCATPPPKVTSTWPVASREATVAPPADALRFPLTGRPVPAGIVYPVSPVCGKLVDSGIGSRAGLSSADVVYETAQTGSGTQIAALFQSAIPARVGPLSPAGMPDLWVMPQYRAALFSTGAAAGIAAAIKRAGLIDLSQGSAAGNSAYETLKRSKAAAVGVYLSGPLAKQQMLALGSSVTSDSAALRFSTATETTAAPTSGVSIPFSASQVVDWEWNAKARGYLRSKNGHAQRDATGSRPITANNVVVMWAKYTPLDADVAGEGGFDVTLGGEGQATVFRDGTRIDGRWKADGASPPTFAAESGESIRLAPGATWFEVIPLAANITMR